ncbi:GD12945 [Drosophila simulans]|uniref:GD12945 n=1 Tax=Drosophila simulans TaxID=7240 RepID=B4NVI4_DROSI|nr:GD12945 [Drosophila simulans]
MTISTSNIRMGSPVAGFVICLTKRAWNPSFSSSWTIHKHGVGVVEMSDNYSKTPHGLGLIIHWDLLTEDPIFLGEDSGDSSFIKAVS